MKNQYLYLIVVLVILVIAVVGWYYFSTQAAWITPGEGGGGGNISNSCTDSDGGIVIKIKGTVSGYRNNNYYSYTDVCGGNFF